MPYENQGHRGSRGNGNGRQQDMTGAAGVGLIDSSFRQYPNIKLPIPDLGPPYDASYRRHARNGVQRPSQDDSLYRHRRSEDTNTTAHHSQGSRSRPRSGATAAAIGRLDSVLARGEDLLKGMKTSLALDPEEVRTRSARHLRSSVLKDDHQDDGRFRPYHESLPYWPSKSRFKLELTTITLETSTTTSSSISAAAAAATTATSTDYITNGEHSSGVSDLVGDAIIPVYPPVWSRLARAGVLDADDGWRQASSGRLAWRRHRVNAKGIETFREADSVRKGCTKV
ncbi:hypothetical protein BGZ91_004515 [Linnemannia elongata]|nr:hypothetical protein BGZ91_004515 [Linnemannia elongata]